MSKVLVDYDKVSGSPSTPFRAGEFVSLHINPNVPSNNVRDFVVIEDDGSKVVVLSHDRVVYQFSSDEVYKLVRRH